MAVSVRIRFEIFKRDDFTCRYCGKRSPEVVLEIDHIVPVCEGGTDDLINLAVACWDCNRGKAGIPLSETMTGEDPHDRAILLLENERQLREYNEVLRAVNERVEVELEELCNYWKFYTYISPSEKAAITTLTQVARNPHTFHTPDRDTPGSGRVWSLWDMMNVFQAHQIAANLRAVAYWDHLCDYMRSQGRGGERLNDDLYGRVVRDVTALQQSCIRAGFINAAQKIGLILQRIELDKDRSDVSYLAAELLNVWDAVLEVLTNKRFLTVKGARAGCIDNPNLMGPKVAKAFEGARADIIEAGNCLAAECHTAAVFHMMRAFEWGLRTFAADLGLTRFADWSKQDKRFKYTPTTFAVWEKYIGQLPAKIEKKLRVLSKNSLRQKRQEYYYSVLDDIKTVKEAWRNHVMHARRDFKSEEAEAVFIRVRDILGRMANKP